MNNNIHAISRAIITDQNHILLCQTLDLKNNFYFLPGGHIENKETAEQAIIREIKEEIGMPCIVKQFFGCVENIFTPSKNTICHNHEYNFVFDVQIQNLTKDEKPPQQEKHIEFMWIPLKNIDLINLKPSCINKLLKLWLHQPNNNQLYSYITKK